MLVAGDHLVRRHARHIAVGKSAMLCADAAVQDHLQQHVAKLIGDLHIVVAVHRLSRLAGFLNHILPEGMVRLRPVPRAAARRAQPRNHLKEILVRGARALVYAHPGNQHRRTVIIMRLPVQIAQRNRRGAHARLRRIGKEIDGHLVLKQIRKPELHVGRQIPVVNLGDHLRAIRLHAHFLRGERRHRAHVFGIHAEGNHRAGRALRKRHAAHHAQADLFRQRRRQRAHRRIALRLADRITKRANAFRLGNQRLCRLCAELVKILAGFIQRIERLIRYALRVKLRRRAVTRRSEHQRVRVFHRPQRAHGKHVAAVRAERRHGYDMLILHFYSALTIA